jgi:catechol 2,3-dioxygenase
MGINRLDHATIYAPDLELALTWYRDLLGMVVVSRGHNHVHLSCLGVICDLTLIEGKAGIHDFTFGVDDQQDLDRITAILSRENVAINRTTQGNRPGEAVAIAFMTPSGHTMRLSTGADGRRAGITNFDANGAIGPCGVDHINIIGEVDPQVMRQFLALIGFKFSFSVAMAHQTLAVWMRSSSYDHDLAYSAAARSTDRLHHIAFSVQDGNHYFRLSDRLMEHRLRWEFGPGRHNVGLGPATGFGTNNYAYIKDPVGNRNEFSSGMDQLPDDAEPRVMVIEPQQLGDIMNGWGFEHPQSMMFGT